MRPARVYSLASNEGIGRTPVNAAFRHRNEKVIDLASRLRPGRKRLVERLFEEHSHALRVFLKGRLVPRDEIEDLVQDLFARLMKIKGLEGKMSASSGSNRSYLLTTANNMIVDMQRKERVRRDFAARQHGLDDGRVDERTPEEIVAAQLELEAMRAVIMAMRPRWRQAFVLHRFRNMSYEDISLHMGLTVKQVENCIAQAMKRIRKARRRIESAGQARY